MNHLHTLTMREAANGFRLYAQFTMVPDDTMGALLDAVSNITVDADAAKFAAGIMDDYRIRSTGGFND